MLLKAFALLLAYFLGSIPTGQVLSSLRTGGDLRELGSGNIGATNAFRVGGRSLGAWTLAGDMGKGILAICFAKAAFEDPGMVAFAGFLAIVGHCFSVYLAFEGGKGVATAAGVFLALSVPVGFFSLLVWVGVFWWQRKASLASLAAVVALPLLCLGVRPDLLLAALATAALVTWRHRPNIERLLAGEESAMR